MDCYKLVREFIPTVVKKLHTSVEYHQNLATPVSLCFTAGWLGILSLGKTEDQIDAFLSETRDLDIEDDLMKVSPDVPPSPSKDGGGDSGADIDDAAQQPPPQIQEIPGDIPLGRTT
ncbi:hypothetical protein Tco_0378806 [Tanacetum coccineum]